MRKHFTLLLSLFVIVGLSACSTMTTTDRVSVSATQSWALLPINNLSSTPRAGEKATALIENQLRSRGVDSILAYREPEGLSLVSLLDSERAQSDAIAWAKTNGIRYGVSGTIHEWHYKSGPDKEPAVAMSIKLIDIVTEDVIWQGTNAKTGWGYTNLSGVANSTVEKLIKQIDFTSLN